MNSLYDAIGADYAATRNADPRIAARIHAALGDSRSIVNVGAGTGSYEPVRRVTAAVDPSALMLSQRREGSAACVRGVAAELPFADNAFDAALATLTLHHWPDWRAGVAEMRRVAPRVVIFTLDPTLGAELWFVRDYLPEWAHHHAFQFPRAEEIAATLHDGQIEIVPMPHDCADGFTGAYWARPEAYLDPTTRSGMPGVSMIDEALVGSRLARLADDLASGAWDDRYGGLRSLQELDLGYRLVTGGRT